MKNDPWFGALTPSRFIYGFDFTMESLYLIEAMKRSAFSPRAKLQDR